MCYKMQQSKRHNKLFNSRICKMCLATNVKLRRIRGTHLGSCIDAIDSFKNLSADMPNYICFDCASVVITCYKLLEKSRKTEATLLEIFIKNKKITKPLVQEHLKMMKLAEAGTNTTSDGNENMIKENKEDSAAEAIEVSAPEVETMTDDKEIGDNIINFKYSDEKNDTMTGEGPRYGCLPETTKK